MKKSILILALLMPLSAQSTQTDTDVSKDERQRFEDTRYHKTEPIAARKYREYKSRQQKVDKQQMTKKQKVKSVVRFAVIAGVSYYVGYHQGQHEKHGMKRRPYMGDKK